MVFVCMMCCWYWFSCVFLSYLIGGKFLLRLSMLGFMCSCLCISYMMFIVWLSEFGLLRLGVVVVCCVMKKLELWCGLIRLLVVSILNVLIMVFFE